MKPTHQVCYSQLPRAGAGHAMQGHTGKQQSESGDRGKEGETPFPQEETGWVSLTHYPEAVSGCLGLGPGVIKGTVAQRINACRRGGCGLGSGVDGLPRKAGLPSESFTRNWLTLGAAVSWVSQAPGVRALINTVSTPRLALGGCLRCGKGWKKKELLNSFFFFSLGLKGVPQLYLEVDSCSQTPRHRAATRKEGKMHLAPWGDLTDSKPEWLKPISEAGHCWGKMGSFYSFQTIPVGSLLTEPLRGGH